MLSSSLFLSLAGLFKGVDGGVVLKELLSGDLGHISDCLLGQVHLLHIPEEHHKFARVHVHDICSHWEDL